MKVVVKRKTPSEEIPVAIHTPFIKLEAALKLCDVVPSGGMGKNLIQDGEVTVNGEVCTMRGKKLYPGDAFSCMGGNYRVTDEA